MDSNLINCGMGRVLSNPRAAKPRIEMNTLNLPKIRYRIVSQRLHVWLTDNLGHE